MMRLRTGWSPRVWVEFGWSSSVWVERVDAVQHGQQQDGRGQGEERDEQGITDGGSHTSSTDRAAPVAGLVHGDDATDGPVLCRAAIGKASAKSGGRRQDPGGGSSRYPCPRRVTISGTTAPPPASARRRRSAATWTSRVLVDPNQCSSHTSAISVERLTATPGSAASRTSSSYSFARRRTSVPAMVIRLLCRSTTRSPNRTGPVPSRREPDSPRRRCARTRACSSARRTGLVR